MLSCVCVLRFFSVGYFSFLSGQMASLAKTTEVELGGSPVEVEQPSGPTPEERLAERIAAVESVHNDAECLEAELAEVCTCYRVCVPRFFSVGYFSFL